MRGPPRARSTPKPLQQPPHSPVNSCRLPRGRSGASERARAWPRPCRRGPGTWTCSEPQPLGPFVTTDGDARFHFLSSGLGAPGGLSGPGARDRDRRALRAAPGCCAATPQGSLWKPPRCFHNGCRGQAARNLRSQPVRGGCGQEPDPRAEKAVLTSTQPGSRWAAPQGGGTAVLPPDFTGGPHTVRGPRRSPGSQV